MRRVFIPNKNSVHDYSSARRFGKLVFLTEGPVVRHAISDHASIMRKKLASSDKEDYIAIGSLSVLTAIATSVFSAKHHRVNVLLYEAGEYVEGRVTQLLPTA